MRRYFYVIFWLIILVIWLDAAYDIVRIIWHDTSDLAPMALTGMAFVIAFIGNLIREEWRA